MNEYPYQDGMQQEYPSAGPYNTYDGPYAPSQPFTGYPPQAETQYAAPPDYSAPPPPDYYPPANSVGMYAPQQGYMGYMPQPTQANGPGIASLVLGIFGIILCWIPVLGLGISIVGLILANLGMKRLDGRGIAVAGLVLSIIAAVFSACITAGVFIGTWHLHIY